MIRNIYIIGDLHGSISPITAFMKRSGKEFSSADENVMICLGDVGANYYFDKTDKEFKEQLQALPFTYFIIRGNHEQRPSLRLRKYPNRWHLETFFGEDVYVENDFPNIKYAMDEPAVYNIKGLSTFVIPGAYSVDKYYRLKKGWQWFEQEQLTREEMKHGKYLCKENRNSFDLVLSHTCPIIFVPTDLFLPVIDQSTVDKTMERYLGEIEYILNYKHWIWAHYHADRIYPEGRCIMLFQSVLPFDKLEGNITQDMLI